MPQFDVSIQGGPDLSIEADSPEQAQQIGAMWAAENLKVPEDDPTYNITTPGQSTTGKLPGAIRHGVGSVLSGIGATAQELGGPKNNALMRAGEKTSPTDYEPAFDSFKKTWDPSYLPRAILEGAPGLGTDLAAGAAGGALGSAISGPFAPVGGTFGFLLGAGGSYFARSFGNTAKEVAVARTGDPNAVPTGDDKAQAGAASILEGAIGALPLGRFGGPLARQTLRDVGARGVAKSVGDLALKSGELGLTSAGTNLLHQGAVKQGTDQPIDLNEAAASGVVGGATGVALGARGAAKEAAQAIRFREISPELQAPATQVANALTKKGGLGGAKGDATAYDAVRSDVRSDITSIYGQNKGLKAAIEADPDARAGFQRARSGGATEADVRMIADVARGSHNAEPLINALNRLRALDVLESRSSRTARGMAGGLSGMLENTGMRAFNSPAAFGGAALVGATPLNPIAYAPSTVAALAGVYGGARVIDRALGMRSPVKSFAEKFANGGDTRTAPQPPVQPTPPYQPPANTTGPKMPLIQPWATRPQPPAGPDVKAQQAQMIKQVDALMRALAVSRKRNATNTELTPPASDNITPANVKQATDYMRGVKTMERLAKFGQDEEAPPEPAPQPQPQPFAWQQPGAPRVGPSPAEMYNAQSPLPPTPLTVIEKITKSKGKTEVKQAEPPKVAEAPKAPVPSSDDGLDIPDFLRRDVKSKPASEKRPQVSDTPTASTIDDMVKSIADRREANGGFTHGRKQYETGTRVMLMAREKVAKQLADATGIPFDELRAKAFETRKGQFSILQNELKSRFDYDPKMNQKIEKASRGHSKGW